MGDAYRVLPRPSQTENVAAAFEAAFNLLERTMKEFPGVQGIAERLPQDVCDTMAAGYPNSRLLIVAAWLEAIHRRIRSIEDSYDAN
jgi:hypothetical protein